LANAVLLVVFVLLPNGLRCDVAVLGFIVVVVVVVVVAAVVDVVVALVVGFTLVWS